MTLARLELAVEHMAGLVEGDGGGEGALRRPLAHDLAQEVLHRLLRVVSEARLVCPSISPMRLDMAASMIGRC